MSADVIAFLQWLVNQGASVAIALLVLWKLDGRLVRLDDTAAKLAEAQQALLSWLSRHDGTPVKPL